jgi:glyoxylase I family protein
MAQATASKVALNTFVKSVHGIRYQVKDVARAVAFYTEHLGFKLE